MTSAARDQLNFSHLPRYQKRQFVPEKVNLTDRNEVEALHNQLLERNISSTEDLTRLVLDRSELESSLDQEGSILYIRMTCKTDDPDRVKKYKDFIENVVPAIKPLEDQLNRQYMEALKKFPLNEKRYEIYTKEIRTDLELFVEENVELETKVDLLSQEYQSICGGLTVEFEGKERTLPEMGKFLLDPGRPLREKAWKASAERRLKEKDKLDELFDQMLETRNAIAKNAKFNNFCQYKFKALHRFDYTSDDCIAYHQSVERLVVPLWAQILEKRKRQMKLDILRPWDTSADPLGRSPLKPFEDVEGLITGCGEVFHRINEELGNQFLQMSETGLLDLESRKGKAPGGYQSTLNESRKPFIFMNAVGIDSDVRTLLHEGGHAFHSLACSHDELLDYRHGPMEFNEVASMGMELLADPYLDVFYTEEDRRRSCMSHLEDAIFTLVWVATIDAFQHWIYMNPTHDAEERRRQWLAICKRFSGGVVDWSGLSEEHAHLWHRQLHIFEVPFYYIEYGIAQLGALQLWLNSKKDQSKALKQYRNALYLGGSKPLPELFETAGLKFDFSENTITPLIEAVQQELNRENV